MIDSGLPFAVPSQKATIKIGTVTVKPEKPTQSMEETKKGLEELKKAVQNKVFVENESSK